MDCGQEEEDSRQPRGRDVAIWRRLWRGPRRSLKVFVCGSAIGYYGNRGDEVLREESSPGAGFLAEVCREWEEAAAPAVQAGIRTAHLRTGIVLSPKGGALGAMLVPFKLGLGGRTGDGRQWMSWIDVQDMVGGIQHILKNDGMRGPVNMVAPAPVRNAEFAKTLASVLWRPAIFPMPAFAGKACVRRDGRRTFAREPEGGTGEADRQRVFVSVSGVEGFAGGAAGSIDFCRMRLTVLNVAATRATCHAMQTRDLVLCR